ncbi:MAG: hypothetical protein OXB84_09235, partial [Halobacteriovoraceae bacterium]|nr:hypothetical protein [Halobacteriovoraceae bacterium]
MNNMEIRGLNRDLREFLLDYKKNNPDLSLFQIAKKINVNHLSLKKIMNGQGRPDVSAMINILGHTNNQDKLAGLLKKIDPELVRILEESLHTEYEVPFLSEDHGDYFTKKEYLLILMQAYTKNGSSYREIKKRYGKEGEDRLKELLQVGIVKLQKGRIYGVEKKATYAQKKLHRTLQILMDSYDPSLFGREENWLSLQTESVNRKKAVPAIRNILKKAYGDVREIL